MLRFGKVCAHDCAFLAANFCARDYAFCDATLRAHGCAFSGAKFCAHDCVFLVLNFVLMIVLFSGAEGCRFNPLGLQLLVLNSARVMYGKPLFNCSWGRQHLKW